MEAKIEPLKGQDVRLTLALYRHPQPWARAPVYEKLSVTVLLAKASRTAWARWRVVSVEGLEEHLSSHKVYGGTVEHVLLRRELTAAIAQAMGTDRIHGLSVFKRAQKPKAKRRENSECVSTPSTTS